MGTTGLLAGMSSTNWHEMVEELGDGRRFLSIWCVGGRDQSRGRGRNPSEHLYVLYGFHLMTVGQAYHHHHHQVTRMVGG